MNNFWSRRVYVDVSSDSTFCFFIDDPNKLCPVLLACGIVSVLTCMIMDLMDGSLVESMNIRGRYLDADLLVL